MWLFAACGALLLASGCVPTGRYIEMRSMYEEAASKNRELANENQRLNTEIDRLRVLLAGKDLKLGEAEQIIAAYKKGMGLRFGESEYWTPLPKGGIRLRGVTFRSGSATLTPRGVAALNALAGKLANMGNVFLVVDGHTDTDPVRVSRKYHASNWELSGKRAGAVIDYLVRKKAIKPRRAVVRGWGQFRPLSNKKSENRRVEVFAVPLGRGSGVVPAGTLK